MFQNGRNDDKFNDDFYAILQIFYFFGIYRPSPGKERIVYGCVMFVWLPLNFALGTIKVVCIAYHEMNMANIALNVFIISYGLTMIIQVLTFALKSSKMIEMIKALQTLHDRDDEEKMEVLRKKCIVLFKCYMYFLAFGSTSMMFLYFNGCHRFKLIFPAFYDIWANGYAYYPFVVISVVSTVFLTCLCSACELIHIMCMVRADANLKFLNVMLRRCTDSENLKENEKSLIRCVKYHCAIIR